MMAKRPSKTDLPPPPIGDNEGFSQEQLDIIKAETTTIIQLEAQRDSVNANITAARKKIKAAGCNLDAWRAAKKRYDMDPEKRDDFDRSQVAANEALGIPLQGLLFDNDDGGLPTVQ